MATIILALIFIALIVIIAFLFFKTDIGGSVLDGACGCLSTGILVIIVGCGMIFLIDGCEKHNARKARVSQGKIHQEQFKNVVFVNSQYKPYKTGVLGGIFGGYPGEFSTSISGHQKLPACTLGVTFENENKVVHLSSDYEILPQSSDYSDWTAGQTRRVILDKESLTFEPTRITAQIWFLNSTFVIREVFIVDAQGNLRSQGVVRELIK